MFGLALGDRCALRFDPSAHPTSSTTRFRTLDALLTSLVGETAAEMVDRLVVGADTAGALVVAAGENSSSPRRRVSRSNATELSQADYGSSDALGEAFRFALRRATSSTRRTTWSRRAASSAGTLTLVSASGSEFDVVVSM